MKSKFKFVVAVVLGALFGLSAGAASFRPLDVAEAARWGATHQIVVEESDLTDTNTATFSQVLSNGVIAANTAIVPVALVLEQPFNINDATTNAYNTTVVTVGDSASSNTSFISSTELNQNGTEVYVKLPAVAGKLFTSAAKVTFAFTGMTNNALSSFTKGRVAFYYREVKP